MNLKLFLLVFVALGFTACTVVCNLAQIGSNAIVNGVGPIHGLSASWACSHPDVMQSDIKGWISLSSQCSTAPQAKYGLVGSIVCPMVVSEARSLFVNAAAVNTYVVQRWGCNNQLVGGNAVTALDAACNLIPF